jgi:Tfx family DNA-binding protein
LVTMPQAESFLTDRQKQILELRLQGYTQDRIAVILKTTRANVSIIEKRARQNINRAKATLSEWEQLQSPISIKIQEGTDIMTIPRIIYKKADQNGIKVYENTLDIISKIHENIPEAALHRRANRPINIFISRNGEVSFD